MFSNLRSSAATLTKLSLIGCATSLLYTSPASAAGPGTVPVGCGTVSATFAYGNANGSEGVFSCQVGDKLLSTFGGNGDPTTPGGTGYGMDWGVYDGQTAGFQFSKSGVGDSFNLLFSQGTGILHSGNITIPISIIDPGYTFEKMRVGSVMGLASGSPSVTATTVNSGDISPVSITSTAGAESGFAYFTPGLTSTAINIAWSIQPGEQITQFTLSLDQRAPRVPGVPGPLPLIGAGAAFGFSRRLRSRVRQAAAA